MGDPIIFYDRTQAFSGNFSESGSAYTIITMNIGKRHHTPGDWAHTYLSQSFTSNVTQKIVSASFYGVKVGSGINTDSVLSIHSSYTLGYGKDSIGYGAGTNPLAYPIDLLNSQQVDKTDLPTSFDWIKYDFYPGYGNQYYTMTANVPYVISLNYSVGNDFEITEDDYLAAGFTGTVYDGDLHDGNLSYLFKNIVYSVDAWFTGSSADVMIKLSGDLTEISLNKPVTFYSRTDSLPAIFYSEP